MSSDEFMRRFEAGELGDDAVYFTWYAAKRRLDIRKARVMLQTAVLES
jgi:hypothetical protein